MTKPQNLKTKIFLDGGNIQETKEVIGLLGFLDGQTTNPTLISKNPTLNQRLQNEDKFTEEEVYDFYKSTVVEISRLIPEGSISIEVYADENTTVDQMVKQGREMNTWIPNAHIKLPTTHIGLEAANVLVKQGLRVNMTLCFTQDQAAAVYSATSVNEVIQSLPGFKNVFVSPFIGRLDDRGKNGMDLIKNIITMYKQGDGHVEVLTASVRSLDHLLMAIELGSDIITAPAAVLKQWANEGLKLPDESFTYSAEGLSPIEYKELDLKKSVAEFDISSDLTEVGVKKFASDWNSLIK